MALVVTTWLWGHGKYDLDDVAKLRAGVARHLKEPHRFVCVSDRDFRLPDVEMVPIWDVELTKVTGCFARLRMFDPAWQKKFIWPGHREQNDRLVNIDLDTVITGDLASVLGREEEFLILHGGNFGNPCKFGGALMMLRPGALPQLWSDFHPSIIPTIPHYHFPDDQGWIWQKAPNAAGWQCGGSSGIYVFKKPGWPKEDYLPRDAAMVTFNGWRTPKKFMETMPWIRQHWRL